MVQTLPKPITSSKLVHQFVVTTAAILHWQCSDDVWIQRHTCKFVSARDWRCSGRMNGATNRYWPGATKPFTGPRKQAAIG